MLTKRDSIFFHFCKSCVCLCSSGEDHLVQSTDHYAVEAEPDAAMQEGGDANADLPVETARQGAPVQWPAPGEYLSPSLSLKKTIICPVKDEYKTSWRRR